MTLRGVLRRAVRLPDRFLRAVETDFAWKVRLCMHRDRNPLSVTVTDKYAVKKYAESLGVATAAPLFLTDRPETIPFDSLPASCFIKATHGSGWNILRKGGELYLFQSGKGLVNPDGSLAGGEHLDRARLSREACVSQCRKWLSLNYGRAGWAYSHVPPRILVEETLHSRTGGELKDYRLYTFRGIVKAINVGSPTYRAKGENVFFDPSWDEFILTRWKEKTPHHFPEKPATLGKMIEAAFTLGKPFDFARIDFYDTTRAIVLGEITLYPEGGQRNTPTACRIFNRWLCDQWIMEREPFFLRRMFFPAREPARRSPKPAWIPAAAQPNERIG